MLDLFLILIAYSIIVLNHRKMSHSYMMWGVFLVSLYCLVSYINSEYYTFIPLRKDAISFYRTSLDIADASSDRLGFIFPVRLKETFWYSHQLSYLYYFSKSIYTGQLISILAYALSIPLLYGFIERLECKKYSTAILLFFSLHPMHLIDRVGYLRESWQLLLFMLLIQCFLNLIESKGNKKKMLLYYFLLSFFSVKLHYGFFYVSVSLLFLCLFFWATKRKSINIYIIIFITMAFAFIIAQSDVINALNHQSHAIINNNASVLPNTGYYYQSESLTWFSPVKSFVLYLFSPFPWRISNAVDLFGFLSALLMSALLFFSVKEAWFSKRDKSNIHKVLLLACLVPAFIFAQGVAAYGTSLRHQIITYWGLVILGVPGLISCFKSIFSIKIKNDE